MIADKNPFPGANYLVKGTTTGTASDANRLAILIVPVVKEEVVTSIIGPLIELSILLPVDSIYFNLDSKKAEIWLIQNENKYINESQDWFSI